MQWRKASTQDQCKELMDRIYDELMRLVGLSQYHVPFPTDNIRNQYVDNGSMYFEVWGKAFEVTIQEVKKRR